MKFFASIIFLLFILTTGYNQVVINELYISPGPINPEDGCWDNSLNNTNSLFNFSSSAQPAHNEEWVELYNSSSCDTFDLSCYFLTGTADINWTEDTLWGVFKFPEGSFIPPLGYIIVGGNESDVPYLDYNTTYYKENYWGVHMDGKIRWFMENDNGWIGLFDPYGNSIDALAWCDSWSWMGYHVFRYDTHTEIGCFGPVMFPKARDIADIEFIGKITDCSPMSYQRIYDGSTQWNDENLPTPRACNGQCIEKPVPIFDVQNATCKYNNGRIMVEFGICLMPYKYYWDFDTSITSNYINNIFSGQHYLTVNDTFGCVLRIDTVFVGVDDPGIDFHFEYIADNCNMGTGSIEVIDVLRGTPPYMYKWNTSVSDTTDYISGLFKGPYTVTLTDQNGCESIKATFLDNECNVEVPNTITPNNDGVNDVWELKNLEFYPDNKVEIYNRNGHLIYNTINYQNDWFGLTNDNELLPAATYYYIIYLGQYGILKGSITIVN